MSLYQQMSALVFGEKQIKKAAITPGHFNRARCGMNGVIYGMGPMGVSLHVCKDNKVETFVAVSIPLIIKDGTRQEA